MTKTFSLMKIFTQRASPGNKVSISKSHRIIRGGITQETSSTSIHLSMAAEDQIWTPTNSKNWKLRTIQMWIILKRIVSEGIWILMGARKSRKFPKQTPKRLQTSMKPLLLWFWRKRTSQLWEQFSMPRIHLRWETATKSLPKLIIRQATVTPVNLTTISMSVPIPQNS